MKVRPQAWLAVFAFASATHVFPQSRRQPTLKAIEAVADGGPPMVTIVADGPLPAPVAGSEKNPPRLFFDFTGVSPPGVAGRVTRLPGAGAVAGIRAALFSASPHVTRVVLDLKQFETFRIDNSEQASGRVRIIVGAVPEAAPAAPDAKPSTAAPPDMASGAVAPPVPPAAPAPAIVAAPRAAPPAPPPAPVPAPSPPPIRGARQVDTSVRLPAAAAVEQYRRQLAGSLGRLESRRSVIAAIDLDRNVNVETLEATLAELRTLRGNLEAVKPSDELRPTHDLLLAACGLSATAVSLRLEALRGTDASAPQNAASAAAGALMLFERACVVLGCGLKR